jgi:hypothetical protein
MANSRARTAEQREATSARMRELWAARADGRAPEPKPAPRVRVGPAASKCGCGCGQRVSPGKRFVRGHNSQRRRHVKDLSVEQLAGKPKTEQEQGADEPIIIV